MKNSQAIVIRDLAKRYGNKDVLRGVNAVLERGEVLGYIGKNGAGKSTTVRILTGILGDYTGQVEVCGYDVAENPLEVKRCLGYVPESPGIYDTLTPLEYLTFVGMTYGLKERSVQRRTREMLGSLGLSQELDRPMMYFSKGMCQKVLLVAGMMHAPEVLILDEPLAGLDSFASIVVKWILKDLSSHGTSIFYASHGMDSVEEICHRVAILRDGQVVVEGALDEIRRQGKDSSLERIFTRLTSEENPRDVAKRFLEVLLEAEA